METKVVFEVAFAIFHLVIVYVHHRQIKKLEVLATLSNKNQKL
jgi:phosphoribosyl-ATP pyrophosphohydrolase